MSVDCLRASKLVTLGYINHSASLREYEEVVNIIISKIYWQHNSFPSAIIFTSLVNQRVSFKPVNQLLEGVENSVLNVDRC